MIRGVQSIKCPRCASLVMLESLSCAACATPIAFHDETQAFVDVSGGPVLIDGRLWRACGNRDWQCNWLVEDGIATASCLSCRLVRRRPDLDDTLALEKLAEANADKRRLLAQCLHLRLPVESYADREGGLGFDLLSSRSSGQRITIGHANGIITIDLAETLDAHREALRVRLGEPYRTLLGHFRHEIGHYYQSILLDDEALLSECRELFGDERTSYREALDRHYRLGAPAGWSASYISEYATMHPWEDFAETFAHYLHILGSLWTAAASNVHLQPSTTPLADYTEEPIERVLADWHEVSLLLNRFSRAMGQNDLYPFVLNAPTEVKLGFMHRIVTRITRRASTTS